MKIINFTALTSNQIEQQFPNAVSLLEFFDPAIIGIADNQRIVYDLMKMHTIFLENIINNDEVPFFTQDNHNDCSFDEFATATLKIYLHQIKRALIGVHLSPIVCENLEFLLSVLPNMSENSTCGFLLDDDDFTIL